MHLLFHLPARNSLQTAHQILQASLSKKRPEQAYREALPRQDDREMMTTMRSQRESGS